MKSSECVARRQRQSRKLDYAARHLDARGLRDHAVVPTDQVGHRRGGRPGRYFDAGVSGATVRRAKRALWWEDGRVHHFQNCSAETSPKSDPR
jgi:hypothetical protein